MATTIPGMATGIPGKATTIPTRHPKVVAFRLESVVAFDRNRWSPSTGMGGRLRPEYALLGNHPGLATRYRRAYRVLAVVMLVSPITAFVLNLAIGPHTSYIFFVESAGIWAFAAYWWAKSDELSHSMATAKVLRGQVAGPQTRFGGPLTHQEEPQVDLKG
jgi:hypothetical protein